MKKCVFCTQQKKMFRLFLQNKQNVRRKTFLFDFFSTRRISSFLQRIFYTHRELPAANAAADLSLNTKAPPARLCFRTSKRPDSSRAANLPAEKTVRRQVFFVGGRGGAPRQGVAHPARGGAPRKGWRTPEGAPPLVPACVKPLQSSSGRVTV